MCEDNNSSSDDGEIASDGETASESSEDELFRLLVDQDDDDREFLEGMLMFGVYMTLTCIKLRGGNPQRVAQNGYKKHLQIEHLAITCFG